MKPRLPGAGKISFPGRACVVLAAVFCCTGWQGLRAADPGVQPGLVQVEGEGLAKRMREADERRTALATEALAKQLVEAGKNGDGDAFRHGADELLDHFEGDPREVLKQLSFLTESPVMGMRYQAAVLFLHCRFEPRATVGGMLEIINSPEPVGATLGGEKIPDIREMAARLLGHYRVAEAREPIWRLYEKTGGKRLFATLAGFGEQRAAGAILAASKSPHDLAENAGFLGQLKVAAARPALEDLFRQTSSPPYHHESAAIAWALYQITGEKRYADFLIANKDRPGFVFYLASIRSPEVTSILESGIQSENAMVAQASFLALYRLDRHSPVVKAYLLGFFDGTLRSRPVSMELVYQVAANMSDPEVDERARKADERLGVTRWRFYKTYRGEWSLMPQFADRMVY